MPKALEMLRPLNYYTTNIKHPQMKFFFNNPVSNWSGLKFAILFIPMMLFNFCKEDPKLWEVKSSNLMASQYIKSNEDFSEFAKLVELAGLESILSLRGPYTIMLPNNEAMFAYYTFKNVNSLEDFDEKFLGSLIRNHIIANEIPTGDIGLGAIRDTNAIGDYLITEFQGSDIIVNKYAKIIKRDIRLANGFAHVINGVIDPVTKDLFTIISEDPSYTIFSEGLKISGIKDTLKLISFPYGKRIARTRFTVLAVPDTIYQRFGINNVNDLIAWTGGDPDSVRYLTNPFYRYMEYHCINGTHYLSDLFTQLYPILSHDNNVSMTIDTDYKINFNKLTGKYTGFIIPASNTPAKNGALHCINDLLPVTEPEPSTVIFETTDFFDFKQGDYFQKYYIRWFDGQNTFSKIKWVGDYLMYYYKPIQTENLRNDCLTTIGWWSVSVTFPKVMKGKYNISIFQPAWDDVTNCAVYLDGQLTPYTYYGRAGFGAKGNWQKIADGDFTTTAEHTITVRNISYGSLFWDAVKFEPVK
jgi:uncharacterized surface protein with fasciclin (FAS1) repeats